MRKTKAKAIAILASALLALLLAGFLCLSPVKHARAVDAADGTVSSVEELLTAYTSAAADGSTTIKLGNSITIDMTTQADWMQQGAPNGHLEMPTSVTIDLGGYELTVKTGKAESSSQGIAPCCINIGQSVIGNTPTNTTITIENGTLTGSSYGAFAYVQSGSTLNLEDVTVNFTHEEGGDTDYAAAIVSAGTVDLKNVKFSVSDNSYPMKNNGTVTGSVQDLINASSDENPAKIQLSENITDAALNVPAYANVILDLNGKTITNAAGSHTIVNYGALTIEGTGTVQNTSAGRGAILNYGTVTLNGGTYTRSGGEWYVIKNYGAMTIGETNSNAVTVTTDLTGSSLIANGYYDASDESANKNNITADNACTMVINGGTFTGGMNTVKNDESGVLTINGGTFSNSYEDAGSSASTILTAGTQLTINDGTFVQNDSSNKVVRVQTSGNDVAVAIANGMFGGEGNAADALYLQNSSSDTIGKIAVTISGGTFNGDLAAYNLYGGAVKETDSLTITGGTFNESLLLGTEMSVSISGGDYATIPNGTYLTEDSKIFEYENGGFVIGISCPEGATEVSPVVNKEGTGFATLAEAIKAVTAYKNATLTLYTDINESVTVASDWATSYSVTIDMNERTWTAADGVTALVNNHAKAITVQDGTINGKVAVGADSKITLKGTLSVLAEGATALENAGTLSVSAGSYTGAIVNTGTMTISGGTFTGAITNSGTLTISGGTFSEKPSEEFIKEGCTIVDNGNSTYTVSEVVAQIDRNGETTIYTDAATAIDALQSGDKLTVLSSFSSSIDLTVAEGDTIVLDVQATFNGDITNNGTLTITGDSGVGSVTNGVNGTLYIQGGIYEQAFVNQGTIEITGGMFKGGLTNYPGTGDEYLRTVYPLLKEGYYFTAHTLKASNQYTVTAGTAVASVTAGTEGDADYWTMDVGALDVALGYLWYGSVAENVTITLLDDVTVAKSVTLRAYNQSNATNVAFDLNGHTLSADGDYKLVITEMTVEMSGSGTLGLPISIGSGSSLTVTGGTFEDAFEVKDGASLTVSGGKFAVEPPEGSLATGKTAVKLGDYYEVLDSANVPEGSTVYAGGQYYTTIAAALEATTGEVEITLIDDLSENVVIPAGGEVTLNLNGFTLSNVEGEKDSDNKEILEDTINNYGILTITGNGTVSNTDGRKAVENNTGATLTIKNGTFSSDTSQTIYNNENATLTIEDGTFTSVSTQVLYNKGIATIGGGKFSNSKASTYNHVVTSSMGELYINGGEFSFTDGSVSSAVNIVGGKVVITDGTFTGYTQAMLISSGADVTITDGTFKSTNTSNPIMITASASDSVKVSGGQFQTVISPEYFAGDFAYDYDEETGLYTLSTETVIAHIVRDGETYNFVDPLLAISTAKDGETVVFDTSFSIDQSIVINKSINLDLNGYTITGTGDKKATIQVNSLTENAINVNIFSESAAALASEGSVALWVLDNAVVTVDNITMTAPVDAVYVGAENNTNTASLTLNNCVVNMPNGYGICVYGNSTTAASAANPVTLVLNNSTVEAQGQAIYGNGTQHNTYIEINDSTVTSENTAIFHPQVGTLTIKGSKTEITGGTAIEMRAGILNIEDGTFTATDTEIQTNPNPGSGASVGGAAIAISQHSYNPNIEVNISGGTFNAEENGAALYEVDLHKDSDVDDISISISNGTYNGKIESENVTKFISGGNFSVLPDDTAFAEGLAGELVGDYYVVVPATADEETATLAERRAAQSQLRIYLASFGLSLTDLETLTDSAEATAILTAYNQIVGATTTSAIEEALEAALDAVDAYKAALDAAKADAIDDLEKAAAANEEEGTAAVAVPTYALSAINAAKTPAEIEDYVTAATKEIDELKEQCKAAAEQVESIKQVLEVLQGTDGESGIAAQIAAIEALLGKSTDSATASTIFGMLNDLKSDVASAFNDVAASVDRSMAGVERELDALSAAIEALSGGVDEEALLAAVKAAEEAATAAGSKVDALETLLEGKLDSIDTAITEVNGAIDSVATAQDALKTAVESYKSELTTTVEGLEAAIESIREDVKALTDASAEDRLAVLEQLTKLQTTADGLASAIEALESGTAEDLTALASQLTTLGTSVGNVESVVATIAEDGATSTDLIAVYVCLGVSLALAAATLVLVILKKRS